MKESTRLFLEEEIKSGNYAYETLKNPNQYFEFIKTHKNFETLFNEYLVREFDDVNTFFNTFCHKHINDLEFFQFIIEHADDFKITHQILEDNATTNSEYLLRRDIAKATNSIIGHLYAKGTIESKKIFTDIVLKIAGRGKLLEIGSGVAIPITSLIFANELGEMSSMDNFNSYWSNMQFFRNMGINATREFFDENTKIDGFETIASQRACHGAVAVVEKLANNDREQVYVQELCDCPSPSEEDKMTNLLDHLRKKDSNLKSVSIKRTQTGQKECHINGLDNDDGLLHTFVTNSPMHVDDIAQIICDRY